MPGPAHIGGFYLLMVLLVAAAATAAGARPAIWLGRLAVEAFLGLLGIEPASLDAPIWTYVVIARRGLGLPPLMGLPPADQGQPDHGAGSHRPPRRRGSHPVRPRGC